MKKLFILPLAFFLLCQLAFAQQKMFSSLLEKFNRNRKQTEISVISHRSKMDYRKPIIENRLFNPPSVNSIWQPGKMIESSWDTISSSWMFYDSILFSYNINGDVTLELVYDISGLSQQNIYTYNANAKVTQVLGQFWNGTSWDNQFKQNYSYDANNNLIQETYQNWNGSGWDNTNQYLYTYDANNNQIQYIAQMWNTATSSWDNQWKDDYTYNVSNQMIQLIEQDWNGTSWDNSFKVDFTYNGSGVLTDLIVYLWSGASWDIDSQYINFVWYQWTGDLNTSIPQSYTAQAWNGTSWEDDYRDTYTYDAQGNETDYLYEEWQTSVWVVAGESKNIYTYDANNNIVQDIMQEWVPWLMAVRNSWKTDYSNYTLFSAVNESSSANDNIFIYPNPSSGKANVKISQFENLKMKNIEIYNVYGEKVYGNNHFQINSSSNFQIDLSSQPDGVYLLQLKTSEGIVSRKIIVQK